MARPFLKAFLFCDTTAPRPDGTLDVQGVWQQLGTSQLPGTYSVGIFICWANLSRPLHEMGVVVRVPEMPPFPVRIPVETTGSPDLDWMNMAVLELAIVREGEIEFEIALDGEPYGTCRLPILASTSPRA